MILATEFSKVRRFVGSRICVFYVCKWRIELPRASEMKIFRRKQRNAGKREKRRTSEGFAAIFGGLALFLLVGCSPSLPKPNFIPAAWPRKDIVISCFAEAGGETDAVCRLMAELMAAELGKPASVTNRTGNQGGDAVNFVAAQERDGYHWGGFSGAMLTTSVLGLTETSAANWTFFLVAGDLGVLSVPQSSEYRTLKELVEAAKVSPQKIKVAARLSGSLWHVKLLALQSAAGVEFQHILYGKGERDFQSAVLSGEADAVLAPISEQVEWIRKGSLRPLGGMDAESFEIPEYGTIPSAAVLFPDLAEMPLRQFFGFALPADTPAGILESIATAFEKAMASNEVKSFCRQRRLIPLGWHGEKADRWVQATESAWLWKLHELGLAKESPEDFGIPRPQAGLSQ